MTECVSGEPYSEMDHPDFPTDPLAYVIVYVRNTTNQLEDRRVDFHRSLGGQARVICSCNQYPLIATGRRHESRRVCMTDDCTNRESHVCSNPECTSRLCQKCLLLYPEDGMLEIDPPEEDTDNTHPAEEVPQRRVKPEPKDPHPKIIHNDGFCRDEEGHILEDINGNPLRDGFMRDAQNNVIRDLNSGIPLQKIVTVRIDGTEVDEGQDDEHNAMKGVYRPPLGRVCDFEEDDDEYQSNALQRKRNKDHHDEFFLGNYLTQTNQAIEEEDCRQEDTGHPDDPTLKAPIPTTNAGGFAYEVKDKNDTELFQVPCHVLLNLAGMLCLSYNQRIVGTSA